MNNSNSIQTQLNQEFDRIFKLIPSELIIKIAHNNVELYSVFSRISMHNLENIFDAPVFDKREILALIFLAKDDQGYILKEGDLPNPKLSSTLTLHDIETKFMDAAMTIKINDGEWQKVNLINFIMQGSKIFHLPKNFREIFKKNCFAETQEEIDNLKLITW